MNADEARQLLGLAPTSSFDQAMKARDKRMERYKDDPEKSMQVCIRRSFAARNQGMPLVSVHLQHARAVRLCQDASEAWLHYRVSVANHAWH